MARTTKKKRIARPRIRTTDAPATKPGPSPDKPMYITPMNPNIDFIDTGSTMLNCALGGGWAMGRVANIIGDKSTGKTLLAIEAAAHFVRQYDGIVYYNELEAAFDTEYAAVMGLPLASTRMCNDDDEPRCYTVEDMHKHLSEVIGNHGVDGSPALYIVDSLDALSSDEEQKAEIGAATYGTARAKQMSAMFRQLVSGLNKSNVTLIIISQIRDKIGVTFGRRFTRSGGRALDFYASQVVLLAQKGRINITRRKVIRPIGVEIIAKVDKNKIAMPFREAEFDIIFGFGVDDLASMTQWLQKISRLDDLTDMDKTAYIKKVNDMNDEEYKIACVTASGVVSKAWGELEDAFAPARRKPR